MKYSLKIITLALLCVSIQAVGQKKKVKRATSKYNEYAYVDAIEKYEKLVADGMSNTDIYKKLGNSHFLNAEYDQAASWYGELLALEDTEVEALYVYRYALCLKSIGEYEESDKWMSKYLAENSEDLRAQRFQEKVNYMEDIRSRKRSFNLINLDINTAESDFAPSIYGQSLIFSTARDTGVARRKLHEWNNKPFLNLYQANILKDGSTDNSSVDKLDRSLNGKTHESSTAFTKDSTTMYFTRNNSRNGLFARDNDGVSRLKIYKAKKEDGKWKKIKELPFNGNSYSTAHPTLNEDESRLYFASDMPGTNGESDLFYVDIIGEDTYGDPVNLGTGINTESRETFPFMDKGNRLYFASDGHPGLGGLDIFFTQLDDSEELQVYNVGEPLNSKQDDFAYVKDRHSDNAYFASNREGGKGSDDIYGFIEIEELVVKEPECSSMITGVVLDRNTKEAIPEAHVLLWDNENNVIADVISSADGSFSGDAACKNGSFVVRSTKPEYKEGYEVFPVLKGEDGSVIVYMERDQDRAAVGTDLLAHLEITPIFFDLDKSFIRGDAWDDMAKVVKYMTTYPDVKINIGSHTDSRSSYEYNIALSERRATATMRYLIERGGIDPSRLTAQGFGETQLKNDCADGVRCSEAEHQANRRSEFIVVK